MHVYVFGAGASVPYGVPVTTQLLNKAFFHWNIVPRSDSSHEKHLPVLAQAIDRMYGTHLTSYPDSGQPDGRTLIALSKLNVEDLIAEAEGTGNEELLGALHSVIFHTIAEEGREGVDRQNGEYERLVDNVIAGGGRACFISFNYDFLLDKALVARAPRKWSYHVPFEAGFGKNFASYAPDTGSPLISYLKLHGSLSWFKCISCGGLLADYSFKFMPLRLSSLERCQKCRSDHYRPLLIPPSPRKEFPKVLESAWECASACLREAESLTVIGYSFPSADQRTRSLFLRNFIFQNLGRLGTNTRPRLTVVNPDACVRAAIENWFAPAADTRPGVDTFEAFISVVAQDSAKNS